MVNLEDMQANADWIPHQFDPRRKAVQFVRFRQESFEEYGFLAAKRGDADVWVGVDEVKAMRPQRGGLHFIFHSGFCRSTLSLRALAFPNRIRGLNEPEILNSLARSGTLDPELVSSILAFLGRPGAMHDTVLIKPSNFPNRLIPDLLTGRSDAQAIIVTNQLTEFLKAIVRKGMLGRQWGRQVYLAAATYAGDVRPFEEAMPGMTDLQVAGLGWLLSQNWFQTQITGRHGERIAVLHSEMLDQNRREAVACSAKHLNLAIDRDIETIISGSVFEQDAKTGSDYAEKKAVDDRRSNSAVVEEEIAEVDWWISELAKASGLTVPVQQSLRYEG